MDDAAVHSSAGSGGAVLAASPPALTGAEVVVALQEAAREANRQAARLLRLTHEAARSLGPDTSARAAEADAFGADEVRAALVLSHAAARRRVELAETLVERLPEVLAALEDGLIDDARARAFADLLRDVDDDLAHLACARVLPEAPALVLGALIARLEEVVIALDPGWAARREAAARLRRRVRAWRNPAGTGSLAGHDLPLDRVVGGVARLEALAAAARRAGARAGIDALRADAYLGLVDGTFAGFDDDQIVTALLEQHTTAGDETDTDTDTDGLAPAGGLEADGADGAAGAMAGSDGETDGGCEVLDRQDRVDHREDQCADPGEVAERAAHGRRLRTGTVEVRGRLTTLLGAEDRPGEIAGWGPVTPGTLRALVATRRRAEWRVVVVDDGGHLLFVDITRHRPEHVREGGRRDDIVELSVSSWELTDLVELSVALAPAWTEVCRDVVARFRAWEQSGRPTPEDDPARRLPGAALARWIAVRDRVCVGPGCTRPAHAADLDHTVDHARGGRTTHVNLGPLCRHDHRLKHEGGWELRQVGPGRFRWRSRCGTTHVVAPRPVRRHLPPPSPPADGSRREVPLDLEPLAVDDGDPTGATSSIWPGDHPPVPPAPPRAGEPTRDTPADPDEPPPF